MDIDKLEYEMGLLNAEERMQALEILRSMREDALAEGDQFEANRIGRVIRSMERKLLSLFLD